MPNPAAVCSSLPVSCLSSSSLLTSRSMSSANLKLQSDCHPMDTDDSGMSVSCASSTATPTMQPFSDGCWGVEAFCIIISTHILNSPTVVRKNSAIFPVSNTALVTASYDDLMTSVNQLIEEVDQFKYLVPTQTKDETSLKDKLLPHSTTKNKVGSHSSLCVAHNAIFDVHCRRLGSHDEIFGNISTTTRVSNFHICRDFALNWRHQLLPFGRKVHKGIQFGSCSGRNIKNSNF